MCQAVAVSIQAFIVYRIFVRFYFVFAFLCVYIVMYSIWFDGGRGAWMFLNTR